jgi:hypothetical protein
MGVGNGWNCARRSASRLNGRGRRVALLLTAIVVLSLADLLLTLSHLQSTGMMEANPLAAWLIRTTASPLALTLFKAVTVAVPVVLLWSLRRHVEGEIGAWCATAILVVLSLMWGSYAREMEDPDVRRLVQSGELGNEWLVME